MMTGTLSRIGHWYSIPLLLLVWQVAVTSGLVESRLLPSLGQVWGALANDIASGALPYHAGVTLGRAAIGFALAGIICVAFAAGRALWPIVRNLFEPIFFFG